MLALEERVALADFGRMLPAILDPLRMHRVGIPDEFASATGGNGRVELAASEWMIDDLAIARLVLIRGTSSEILNLMIFPRCSASLPVYEAEMLIFGDVPRLIFVDLQTPGLPEATKLAVAARTRQMAETYRFLPSTEAPPEWATQYSAGGWCFSRPGDRKYLPTLLNVCRDYLALWCEFTSGAGTVINRNEVHAYKRHHVAHSPAREYLGRLFGPEWAGRFLEDWLYRNEEKHENPDV